MLADAGPGCWSPVPALDGLALVAAVLVVLDGRGCRERAAPPVPAVAAAGRAGRRT